MSNPRDELWAIFREPLPMFDATPVLHSVCRERMEAARKLIEADFSSRDKALAIYAKVSDTHFASLNNLYDKMAEERKLFLFKSQHDAFFTEYRVFRDETRQAIIEWRTAKATLEAMTARQMARWSLTLLVITTSVTVIVAFISHLVK